MVKKDIQEVTKEKIYIMKAFSVFSIVTAHINLIPESTSYINRVVSSIFSPIAIIGVCVFFILSGFLFSNNKRSFKQFFERKISSIIIPWITTGTAIYLYVYLRKGGISLMSYISYISGEGSYLYFITVLIILYIMFFYIKKEKWIYILIIVSVISSLLTVNKIITINPYLNVFNWCGYFGIGILLQRKKLFNKLSCFCNKNIKIITSILIILILINTKLQLKLTYWSYMSFIVIIVGILFIFGIEIQKKSIRAKVEAIGKKSFSIYLLHMPVAGIIVNIFNRYDLDYLTIFRPFIVIYIVVIFINIYMYINKKIKNDYSLLIGYRE